MSDSKNINGGGEAPPDQKSIDRANTVIQTYNQMRQKITELGTKIDDINVERQEHMMCVDALTPLDVKRRCFRYMRLHLCVCVE
jgi:hypothetical protein